MFNTGYVRPPVTIRWEPTCAHGEVGRSLVLDPFCGSGTTGQVALHHGRDFVGVDASAEYLALAAERLGTKPRRVREPEVVS